MSDTADVDGFESFLRDERNATCLVRN